MSGGGWVEMGVSKFLIWRETRKPTDLPKSIPLITHQSTNSRCLSAIGHIFGCSGRMMDWSDILGSSRQALSIYGIYSLIRVKICQKTRSKMGLESRPRPANRGCSRNFSKRSKFEQNTIWQPLESSFQCESNGTIINNNIIAASLPAVASKIQ